MQKTFRYSHICSSVEGKQPTPSQLNLGEIAVNFAAGNEHLFIKNSSGDIISFDTPIEVSSAVTSGDTNPVQSTAVYEVIAENELVIANALNALDEKKLDASAYTTTSSATEIADALALKLDIDDFNTYSATVYTKDETSGATELSTEFAKYYLKSETSSKTEIDESISGKVDNSVYTAYTASTDTALGNKQDVSGMTAYTQTTAFTAHTADTTIHHTATSAVTANSTDVLTSGGAYNQFGGLKLVKLTQAEYDALSPNYDASTVYIIVD